MTSEPQAKPPSGPARARGPRRRRSQRQLALWFAASVLGGGALTGLMWHTLATLPTYSVGDSGAAQISERALGQVFATDGSFVIIGSIGGVALGFQAWRSFRSIGWPVSLLAVGGGLASGLVCWGVGVLLGPRDFAYRISTAQPSESLPIDVPVDFELHAMSALLVWGLGAIIPVMLYANLSHDDGEPAGRRSVPAQPREPGPQQVGKVTGRQLDR